jgi:phosphoglycolate phosphatase
MYSRDRLVILDADGTTVDAFSAIDRTFAAHGMSLGDLERFQKRHNLLKYLGGLKEFPGNLRRQIGKTKRSLLLTTLTEVYREEATLYPGIAALINRLVATGGLRVGILTRNITREPEETLTCLYRREGVEVSGLDFLTHIPLKHEKAGQFRAVRARFAINPARCYACGDERTDYEAAVSTGTHPFMVSYGFEDHERLTRKIGVPEELISREPADLCRRLTHALDLDGTEHAVP